MPSGAAPLHRCTAVLLHPQLPVAQTDACRYVAVADVICNGTSPCMRACFHSQRC